MVHLNYKIKSVAKTLHFENLFKFFPIYFQSCTNLKKSRSIWRHLSTLLCNELLLMSVIRDNSAIDIPNSFRFLYISSGKPLMSMVTYTTFSLKIQSLFEITLFNSNVKFNMSLLLLLENILVIIFKMKSLIVSSTY